MIDGERLPEGYTDHSSVATRHVAQSIKYEPFIDILFEQLWWAYGYDNLTAEGYPTPKKEAELIARYGSDPWCGKFVIYCAEKAGLCDGDGNSFYPNLMPNLQDSAIRYFEQGFYVVNSTTGAVAMGSGYTPQVGDIFFYLNKDMFNNNGGHGYIGIVIGFDGGMLITVEGNVGANINGEIVYNSSLRVMSREYSEAWQANCYYINMGMGTTVPSFLSPFPRFIPTKNPGRTY